MASTEVSRFRGNPVLCIACCSAVCLTLTMLGGCSAGPRAADDAPPAKVHARPLPEYASISQKYNERVRSITRLSSQISVVIESDRIDGSGRTRDQLDGNLSVVPPWQTALRLDKAGVNAAYLGSNDFAFWWFDLSGSEPMAMGGSHRNATREDARDFGLPVHPLEFIELLAVLPVPEAKPSADALAWSDDDQSLLLSVPSRWGTRRLTLDPVTCEPSAIDLLNERDQVAVGAKLSAFKPAFIEGKPGTSAQVPTKIELWIREGNTRVLLVLAEPKIPLRINPRVFELSKLMESYSVKKFIDHDELSRLRREREARERAAVAPAGSRGSKESAKP
ncbi:MAG: hypothetical protein NTV94_11660 [Planctomycetota bacterium]|nr:hypothetical protein [Planctomycetota bacterium]